jgi:hypothetical protein
MKNLEEIKRGEEANRLMEHPLIREAFDKVHAGILQGMRDSPFGDEKTHNRLVIALQLLGQIEKHLKDTAATGKMAKIQMEKGTFGHLRAAAGF